MLLHPAVVASLPAPCRGAIVNSLNDESARWKVPHRGETETFNDRGSDTQQVAPLKAGEGAVEGVGSNLLKAAGLLQVILSRTCLRRPSSLSSHRITQDCESNLTIT